MSSVSDSQGHRLSAVLSYRCPPTGRHVQAFLPAETGRRDHEIIACPLCAGTHVIDRRTGDALPGS